MISFILKIVKSGVIYISEYLLNGILLYEIQIVLIPPFQFNLQSRALNDLSTLKTKI